MEAGWHGGHGETNNKISVICNKEKKVQLATHALQYVFHGFTGFRFSTCIVKISSLRPLHLFWKISFIKQMIKFYFLVI